MPSLCRIHNCGFDDEASVGSQPCCRMAGSLLAITVTVGAVAWFAVIVSSREGQSHLTNCSLIGTSSGQSYGTSSAEKTPSNPEERSG